ncbi:hypothetical protein KEM52_003631, partial [Ascosphaera acerosa]
MAPTPTSIPQVLPRQAITPAQDAGPSTVTVTSAANPTAKNTWLFWPDGMVSIPNSYTDLTSRPGTIAGIVVGSVLGLLLVLALLTLCLYHMGAADVISTRFGSERSSDLTD